MTKIYKLFFSDINNDLKHYSQTVVNIAHVTEPKLVFTPFRLTRNHQSQSSTKPSTVKNKVVICGSFFNLFSSPEVTGDCGVLGKMNYQERRQYLYTEGAINRQKV